MIDELPFTLDALRRAYAEGLKPRDVVTEAFWRLAIATDPGIFIHEARDSALAAADALGAPDGRPLWGIPFVVKDNIDVAGMPTTAACPDFAYLADRDAFVVARLREAGAIVLGKTNLDQFATGLVGVRTPYPVPRNAIDPAIVPGGSSSGSAVAVARGIACFSLGTDTAGSGRVPAALNSIVGLKPTLGAYSATGVVPACRTLDTISVFALTVADAWEIHTVASGHDPADAWSRAIPAGGLFDASAFRIGVPDEASLETFGDVAQAASFRATVERLRTNGATIRELDFTPFYDVARMLYEGAWLAERVAAVGPRLTETPETLHPTTRAILEPGLKLSAVDAFEGFYRLKALRRDCEAVLAGVDALCVPTIPSFVTLDEIAADPIGPNARLGTYTNFVNLLDMCGIAVPVGARADGRPGSVTLLAAAGRDALCASIATSIEAGAMGATDWVRPAPPPLVPAPATGEIALAVCGAHMSGLPLNRELTERGGRFIRACSTAPAYRLHALAGGPPFRPGLVRQARGAAIKLEVWALPQERFGDFIAGIPAPLGIGTVELEDGTTVKGFLCEAAGLAGAADITEFGGWRAYLARPASSNTEAAA
ncbi:allophanate hydrolase [Mesorhizobium sp. J428]|uniref:allophanate hydrolase n=1 Tax=Mesorhizobium sp. J428 TaxID=2898440 RepID=UPI0021515E03|nr:allophanate hydrolase [Mesorhizobium sp. J428]MCR5856672.1 allophanate hydrolase [Mesorhizobium sp. J428]